MSRRKLTYMTTLPIIAGLGVTGAPIITGPVPFATPAAQAQVNPCAPAQPRGSGAGRGAMNPCAPVNPCAARPGRKASPCAPRARDRASPCAARPAFSGPAANPFDVPAGYAQAPYGDQMPDIVKNYLRAAPYVGTGGVVDITAFDRLKALGFKSVINLNTVEEGAPEEEAAAKKAGLTYIHIPVSSGAPSPADVEAFSDYVNDPAHYPVLVHCQSSNRVGAMWALYRAANGVPPGIAVQEGRTVGLKPSREGAVRERLGLPPLEE
ncbi:MAG: sulfur transferase domain-containing protein [Alphaproteobacteria bacterium]